MVVHTARIGNQDCDRHLLGLNFFSLGVQKLEYTLLVFQVDFLLASLVAEWYTLGQGSSWLALGIDQEVANRIHFDFLLPGIKVAVEGADEENFISHFVIIVEAEVEINLFVVLPDISLLHGPILLLLVRL